MTGLLVNGAAGVSLSPTGHKEEREPQQGKAGWLTGWLKAQGSGLPSALVLGSGCSVCLKQGTPFPLSFGLGMRALFDEEAPARAAASPPKSQARVSGHWTDTLTLGTPILQPLDLRSASQGTWSREDDWAIEGACQASRTPFAHSETQGSVHVHVHVPGSNGIALPV